MSKTDGKVLFDTADHLIAVRADVDYAVRILANGRRDGIDAIDCHEVGSILRQVLQRLDRVSEDIGVQLLSEQPCKKKGCCK